MATPKVYAICDANCRWETLTKEEILAAITQAVNEGTISNVDAGFITKVKTINGQALQFFVGTQAEYDALTNEQKKQLFAIISNDTTKEGILSAIEGIKNGVVTVGHARFADNATNATNATNDSEGRKIEETYSKKFNAVTIINSKAYIASGAIITYQSASIMPIGQTLARGTWYLDEIAMNATSGGKYPIDSDGVICGLSGRSDSGYYYIVQIK